MPGRLVFVMYEASLGGVERQAELLAEAAKAAGYSIVLIILGEEGPVLPRFAPFCEAIRVLQAPIHSDRGLRKALRGAVAGERYAGAFLFSTARVAVLSNALREAAPRQVVYVGNPVSATQGERWKQTVRSWLFPPSPDLKLAANSRHTERSLLASPYYRRFPILVSGNCVRVPEEPMALRERCEPIRLGMVARLDPIKDHETLLRAVALLRDQRHAVECELVGGGVLEGELQRLAADLHLMSTGAVVFRGWTDDVPERLRRWDLFVFSTTAQEGFGSAAAEAMAVGLPCIFTDVGPCREVGGEAAVYVPPKDAAALAAAITKLAGDPKQRRRLGAEAQQRVRELFLPSRNLADFLAAIGEPVPGSTS